MTTHPHQPAKLGRDKSLKSRISIDALFKRGERTKAYPLLFMHRFVAAADEAPFQLVYAVPKRSFRRAHERNFIKRRMREAVRLQQTKLLDFIPVADQRIEGVLLYTGRDLPTTHQLARSFDKLLNRLSAKLA